MRRDQLLLLAKCAQEAKGVGAEADRSHERERHDCRERARHDARPLAPGGGSEHHKWQHQPRGGLHADPDDEQSRGAAEAEVACLVGYPLLRRAPARLCGHPQDASSRARGDGPGGPRRKRQGPGQDEQYERVVVGSTNRQLQQNWIQADEHGGQLGRASHPLRGNSSERDRSETRQHGDRL
jgi:hypothetical protein